MHKDNGGWGQDAGCADWEMWFHLSYIEGVELTAFADVLLDVEGEKEDIIMDELHDYLCRFQAWAIR